MDTYPFWSEALKEIRASVSPQEELWFKEVQLKQIQDSTVVLTVPSELYRRKFKEHYQKNFEEKLELLSGQRYSLDYSIEPGEKSKNKSSAHAEQKASFSSDSSGGEYRQSIPHAQQADYTSIRKRSGLSAEYTFDSFVIGENNQFAANAAIAIAQNPGLAYNPCLIYGKVGLGKTHLLQSVGNYSISRRPQKSVIYVTAEAFTNEFIHAIQNNAMHTFKLKYREVDLLLIDDVHFLKKKPETQEELFHTFNALFEAKKQMIFTCDRPMSEIKDITERLQNRFTRGLTVDLHPPKIETAIAILQKKALQKQISIPTEVLTYICQNIRSNVRDLEAALTKVIHYADVLETEITIKTVRPTLQTMMHQSYQGNIPIATVQKAVAEYYSVSISELKGKSRTNRIVFPRKVAVYLSREHNESVSYADIGLEFGGRDHTTIIHSYQDIKKLLQRDPGFSSILGKIITSII